MDKLTQSIRTFMREDDGAQIIEYALIIAAVSLILIVALQGLNNSDFTTFVTKVGTCLTTSVCA
jgi:pilus assembly protein Flp/PilA